jgi:hypothetical protein
MRFGRTLIVSSLTLVLLALSAGPAVAGGRPDPAPSWIDPAIFSVLVVLGVVFACVVAIGIEARRERRSRSSGPVRSDPTLDDRVR